jgi:hypothetical protein
MVVSIVRMGELRRELVRRLAAFFAVVAVVVAIGVVVEQRSGGEKAASASAGVGVGSSMDHPAGSEEHEHSCPNRGTDVAGVWTCVTGNKGAAVLLSRWSFDARPTVAQRKAAERFRSAAVAAAHRYADYNVARANGYTFDTLDETVKSVLGTPLVSESLDGLHQGVVTHLVNPTLANDGTAVDPTKPDALVYATNGSRYTLIGVMFMAPNKSHPPQPGGPLTTWHYHENASCLDRNAPIAFPHYRPGDQLYAATGACPSGTLTKRTGQMLHVWLHAPKLSAAFLSWGDVYVKDALRPGRGTVRTSDGPEKIATRSA